MELYYPVKQDINQTNLFGANPAQYLPLKQKGHPGNDFECPLGTPLYAPCDGDAFYTTDKAGGDGFWIRFPNNTAPQFNIILWHMPNAGNPTYPFQIPTGKGTVTSIKAGEFLGYTGNSGYPVESTGPHLHLGIIPCDATGEALNPNNGYLGCVDPQPFYNGLYAENINHPPTPQTIEKAEEVVTVAQEAITIAKNPNASLQDKNTLLQAVEGVINTIKKLLF